MASLSEHARHELVTLGYDLDSETDDPNNWMLASILELITTFANQGHSGASASYCIEIFTKLAKFEPLTPLTGEDNEWEDVGDGLYQNKRCSRVFRHPDGTAFDVRGRVFLGPDGDSYINGASHVNIQFPYTPKTEYVEVKSQDTD